jgi:hypothetical protein
LSLLGRSTYAASAAAETRTTALGLALIVFEHEKVVVAGLELGAS